VDRKVKEDVSGVEEVVYERTSINSIRLK